MSHAGPGHCAQELLWLSNVPSSHLAGTLGCRKPLLTARHIEAEELRDRKHKPLQPPPNPTEITETFTVVNELAMLTLLSSEGKELRATDFPACAPTSIGRNDLLNGRTERQTACDSVPGCDSTVTSRRRFATCLAAYQRQRAQNEQESQVVVSELYTVHR